MKATLAQTIKDLKGKKYAIDKNGKVLPLALVRPEKLPPFAVPLGLNITDKSNERVGSRRGNTGTPAGEGGRSAAPPKDSAAEAAAATTAGGDEKRKKKIVRVAGSRAIDESYFKASNTLATTLAGGYWYLRRQFLSGACT